MYARSPRKRNKLFFAFFFLLAPLSALANVSFTEIMYDVPGADTGHEWLEIQNTGGIAVDIKNWRLAEGGVNHKLLPQRSSVLDAGAYAVIANDAKKFSADYPAYSGALFQSSFSLSNTGEALALKDASSTEMASLSYTSAAGASGDGNTLNNVNGAWVSRKSSPGASVSAQAAVPPAQAAPSAVAKSSAPKSLASKAVPQGNPTLPDLVSTTSPATGSASFGILPWIFGLLAVILAGTGAIFMLPKKKPADEYTIIEDES